MAKRTAHSAKRYLSARRLSRNKVRVKKRRDKQLSGRNGVGLQNISQKDGPRLESGYLNDVEDAQDLKGLKNRQELNVRHQSEEQQLENEEQVVGGIENAIKLADTDYFEEATSNHRDSVENTNTDVDQETRIEGRCIADISYFLDQLHEKFDNHNPALNCPFSDLKLIKTWRCGLKTQIVFQCARCCTKMSISTDRDDNDKMDINRSAVSGTIATGIGFSQMEEFLAAMDIPCMAATTYRRFSLEMCAAFEKAAAAEIKKAAEVARDAAIGRGDYVIHGNQKIPYITVVADCSWMKRSYKSGKYDSLSGVGAILDYRTGKLLFRGVRNKFCAVCELATRNGKEPNIHVCFKNWGRDQASTGMESDSIVEGFKTSVETNGLIYKTLIADGDSSVYKSILDNNPYAEYDVVVDKKECVNHLLRNLARKIKDIARTPGRQISKQKKIISSSVKKFRNAIVMAAAYRQTGVMETADEGHVGRDALHNESTSRNNQIALLKTDIWNIPYHIFGDHQRCKYPNGFCNGDSVDGEENVVEILKKTGLFQQLETYTGYLSFHAPSLIYNATNNIAEAYNSIICKMNGGKRINFGMRGSYKTRCDGSVLQHNTQNILTKLHQSEQKHPPSRVIILETRRKHQIRLNAEIRRRQKVLHAGFPKTNRKRSTADKNYGPNAEAPDLDEDLFNELETIYRNRLLENQNIRLQIEKDTREQSNNALWQSLRRKMLTASNFGKVCRMRTTTSCSSTVQSILYPSVKNTPAILWGRTKEAKAIRALEKKLTEEGIPASIQPCGLFIDSELAYLGASPDGVIGNDGIVEIKCPMSAQSYTPNEALELNESEIPKFFDKTDRTKMNTSHLYYYQVQGQLHITQRLYCYFAVWTPMGLKYVTVMKDNDFWKTNMEPQLVRFYNNCLLPEIIDSRYNRKLPIRDPKYILEAKQMNQQKIRVTDNSEMKMLVNHEKASTKTSTAKLFARGEQCFVQPTTLMETQMSISKTIPTTSYTTCAGVQACTVDNQCPEENRGRIAEKDQSHLLKERLRVMPLKLIRHRSDGRNYWSVSSSDEEPQKQRTDTVKERTGPQYSWVEVHDSDVSQIPTKNERAILDCVNKDRPFAEIKADVLTGHSLLNDTSIDKFLEVVRNSSTFAPRTTLWLTHARFIEPLRSGQDIQIIGGNTFRHWRCIHFDGTKLNIYDSSGYANYDSLKSEEKRYIEFRYPRLNAQDVLFRKVQKQPDTYSCGVYAAAFTVTIVLGGDPVNESYSTDVMKMRKHLLKIIETRKLSPFPCH